MLWLFLGTVVWQELLTDRSLMRYTVACRLFLSAEPPPALERGLPINLLQNSIKLTNEPPEGLRPNLIRAFNSFNEEMLESCAKQVCLYSCLGAAVCGMGVLAPWQCA